MFNAHAGYDHISDWQNGVDRIDLRQLADVHGIGSLQIFSCDGDAVIAHGEMLIRVHNAAGQIEASDLLFAA